VLSARLAIAVGFFCLVADYEPILSWMVASVSGLRSSTGVIWRVDGSGHQ
jgi:hypothetical protein